MMDDCFHRLQAYQEMIWMLQRLLEKDYISLKEFSSLEQQAARKYGFGKRSIFREMT